MFFFINEYSIQAINHINYLEAYLCFIKENNVLSANFLISCFSKIHLDECKYKLFYSTNSLKIICAFVLIDDFLYCIENEK